MELKYAGLCLMLTLSLVVWGTTARPGTMISAHTPDMKVDPVLKVNKLFSESTLADEMSDHGVPHTDKYVTGLNLEDAGVTHEERMLAATVNDYGDPGSNENPKRGNP